MRRIATRAALLAAAVLLPTALSAQIVRGTLVDEATGTPIGGALVALVDASGATVARSLSDETGRFALRTASAGAYTLRADRIGFRRETAAIALGAGQTLAYRMAVRPAPVSLSAVRITGEKSCAVRRSAAGEGERQTASVWEEARKALDATAMTQEQRLFSATISHYDRVLDPRTLRVITEQRQTRAGVSENPFVAASTDKLAHGYVQEEQGSTVYYAPDARVLLSDAFLDGHCFWLERGKDESAGLLGLAFEPVRGQKLPDVRGTLWIDPRSSELRHLEWRYLNLPRGLPEDRAGGRIDFRRMPSGAWIVQKWSILMPRLKVGAEAKRDVDPFGRTQPAREQLAAVHEVGGEVSVVSAGAGASSGSAHASVAGTVYDSTRSAPLAGARVFISGTPHSATADAEGRFALERIPPGTYGLVFSHPRLDSLGIPAQARDVRLTSGQGETVALAVPPLRSVIAMSCAGQPEAASGTARTGLLHGVVRDAQANTPIPAASVRVTWKSYARGAGAGRAPVEQVHGVEARANASGRYRACGIPADGTPLSVQAEIDGRRSPTAEVRLMEPGVEVRDLRVP